MKQKIKLFLLCLPAMFLFGCASILPGHDPIVVNAERTTKIALSTFDTFLKYEYENKDMLEKISPGIHGFAEQVRRKGPTWIQSARNLTLTYKNNRSEENKFQLETAVAVLQAAVSESQKYIKVGMTTSNP